MYHQFGKFAGRLVAATHLQSPLFPITPAALQKVEVPNIVHTASKMSTVTQSDLHASSGPKRMVPGTNIPFGEVPESLRKRMEQFQKEDDVPVFLKGGPMDNVLYRLTMVLCVVGVIGVLDLITSYAAPKKN